MNVLCYEQLLDSICFFVYLFLFFLYKFYQKSIKQSIDGITLIYSEAINS